MVTRGAPMPNSTPLIRMENISKVFYADEVETHALSGINLEMRKGEYVSVAGPSGSGKSTLVCAHRPAGFSYGRGLRLERGTGPRARSDESSCEALSCPAFRRAAAACCRGPRPGRIAVRMNPRVISIRTTRKLLWNYYDLHREGATICMVTHDPRFARHAERQIHLVDGRKVEVPAEVS
jgi:hypothetical protein